MKYFNETYEKILRKYKIKSCNLRQEFDSILANKKIEEIFDDLHINGILSDVLPEFLPCINLDQKNIHHAYPVHTHILKAVKGIQANKQIKENKTILLWTMLLHDIGKPVALNKNLKTHKRYRFTNHATYSAKLANKILKRFSFSSFDRKKIVTLVRYHEFFRYIKLYNMETEGNRLNTKHVFGLINKIGVENFELLLACHKADYEAQSDYWHEHKNTVNARANDMLEYYKKLKKAKMKVNF